MECNFAWHVVVSMLNLEKFEPWPYCAFRKCRGWGEIKIFIPIIYGDFHGHTNL